jgi:hypothetical protein
MRYFIYCKKTIGVRFIQCQTKEASRLSTFGTKYRTIGYRLEYYQPVQALASGS